MAERYKRLYALPENLYTSGSPILIQAVALLKDTQTGKILAQLKLKNLFHSTLVACKVSIRAFTPSGEEVKGVENYSYLDLNVVRGQSFGAQVPIYLPDGTTRKISVFVTEAVYEDGGVWRQEKKEWRPVPQQKRLADHFTEVELRKQYAIEVGGNCDFVPETVEGLFLCACGAANLAGDETCWQCGRKAADLLSALDLKALTSKMDARLKAKEQKRIEETRKIEEQRLEQERRAEEKRIANIQFQKKLKRWLALGIGVATLCTVVGLLMTKVIIPNKKYNDAVALEKAGNYQEAIAAFEAMGDYKDSPEKILECKYAEAEAKLEAGDFPAARAGFNSIGGYSDALERINDVRYAEGEHFIETKEYGQALKIFTELGDYKESKERLIATKKGIYQLADELEQAGNYIQARDEFEKIEGYDDSAERCELINKSIYNQGLEYLAGGDYEAAYQKFSYLDDEYLESKDYRIYSEIRKTNFDDRQLHFLDDLMEKVKDISNDILKEELKDIPQIAMCIQLEGKWIEEHNTGFGYRYYGKVIDIRDGKIDGDAISYFNGEYFSGINFAPTDNYRKIRCEPEETPYTAVYINYIGLVEKYIRLSEN